MATGGNQQTASPLAEWGSYSVKDSAVNSTIHLCRCRDSSIEAYGDKIRAVRAAALVWPDSLTLPSGLPGVEVLGVYGGWDERMVDGLQQAESRGHRSVAVMAWGYSIKKLFDHAASRRAAAAADIWVVRSVTDWLSSWWQQELSDDAASRRAAAAADIWVLEDDTAWLSRWQQQLSDDARYQRL